MEKPPFIHPFSCLWTWGCSLEFCQLAWIFCKHPCTSLFVNTALWCVYPGVGLLGQRASLFNEEHIVVVAERSFHRHFRWLPLGRLRGARICITSFCSHQTRGCRPSRANSLSKHYHHPDVAQPPAGVQGSSSGGLKALGGELEAQNAEITKPFPMGNGSWAPKSLSHTFGPKPAGSCQQGRVWQESEGSAGLLAGAEGFTSFMLFCPPSLGWTVVLRSCF